MQWQSLLRLVRRKFSRRTWIEIFMVRLQAIADCGQVEQRLNVEQSNKTFFNLSQRWRQFASMSTVFVTMLERRKKLIDSRGIIEFLSPINNLHPTTVFHHSNVLVSFHVSRSLRGLCYRSMCCLRKEQKKINIGNSIWGVSWCFVKKCEAHKKERNEWNFKRLQRSFFGWKMSAFKID